MRARAVLPRLPAAAWAVLGGDALSAVGSGLTVSFLLVYFDRVRGIDIRVAGLAVAALAAAGFVGNPLGGWLSDRIGPKRALLGGLLASAAGAFSVIAVRTEWHAFAAAALVGLGASVAWPSQDALLAIVAGPEHRSSVFAVRHATMNVGLGIGGLLAALIVDLDRASTFVTLYVIDGVTFLAFVPILLAIPGAQRVAPEESEDLTHGAVRAVLRDRAFRRLWLLTAALFALGYAQFIAAFPAFVTRPGGVSASVVGIGLTVNTVVVFGLQLVTLRFLAGRKRTSSLAMTCLWWALAWTVAVVAGGLGSSMAAVLAFIAVEIVFGIGETFLTPAMTPIVNDLAPDALRGRYNGIHVLSITTGYAIGPIIAGFALDADLGSLLFGVLAIACVGLAFAARRLEPLLPPGANIVDRVNDDTTIERALELRRSCDYASARAAARAAVDRAEDGGRAEALLVLSRLEEDCGDDVAAEAAAREALLASGTDERMRAGALTRLAAALTAQARHDEAEAAVADALRLAAACAPGSALHVEALLAQVLVDVELGRHDEAERAAGDALELAEHADAESRANALRLRATVGRARGRYDDAYKLLVPAREATAAAFGERSLEMAFVLNERGICGKFSGRFDDAYAAYSESLAIVEAAFGEDHHLAASLHHNFGGLAHARRDFVAAEPHARRSVEIRTRLHGPDHLDVAADEVALAAILQELDQDDEAEALLRRALGTYERVFGPVHHEIGVVCGNLGTLARRQGRIEEAADMHERALAVKEAVLGPSHPEVAITLNNLGVVRRRQGRLDEAAALYLRAIDILDGSVDPDHPTLGSARRNLARVEELLSSP